MHDNLLACLPALPACSSSQLCLPIAACWLAYLVTYSCLLAVFWMASFAQLCMTIYLLVLPVLSACFLAYLASYACLLAACWLAGLLCMTIYWLVLPVLPACLLLILPVMPAYYSRLLVGWFYLLSITSYWLVFACLACLLVDLLASYACLQSPAGWLVLSAMHGQLSACFACLACLLVGLSCQLCLPLQ
jgi:hypothetical protein